MGYSIKTIERAAKHSVDTLEANMERHAQLQGEAVAKDILNRTQNGRGLWLFLLIPGWIAHTISVALLIENTLKHMGLTAASFQLTYLLAPASAILWYRSSFTRQHPLLSFLGLLFIVNPILVSVSFALQAG